MSSKENREQRLLLFFSKKQDYVTSEELANLLNVSKKTVYRLIKKINDESDGTLLLSEKGRGYKLDYEKYISQNRLRSTKTSHYTPAERRKRVMEELLLSSPKAKNVYDLYEEYYVGDSVISTDEQIISKELAEYDLVLARKNRTIAIIGKEANIRKAISDLIQLLNIIDIDELRSNKQLNFNNYDVLFVLDQLRMMEKQLNITIPYPYNVNIFSHLYILISRSRKVGTSIFAEKVAEVSDGQKEKDLILHHVAQETITNVENYLHEILSENEAYYLYQYLVSSRMEGKETIGTHVNFSSEVEQITRFYLDEMSTLLNTSTKNEAIFVDLGNHIKPMLNRLAHNIRVKNSLLTQIKMGYGQIYQQVTKVSQHVSEKYHFPEINEDENGFITLYFARIIESNQVPIKTIIMCTTGVGTSELLKVKVAKKFPELEIIAVVSTKDSKKLLRTYTDIELILTTVQLTNQVPITTLLVSAMFTADDQRRLQKKIEVIYEER